MPFTAIRKCSLLKDIDDTFLIKLISDQNMKSYEKDQYIFHQGSQGDGMFVVLEGEVSIILESVGEETDMIVYTPKMGDFFGELSFLKPLERTASAKAATDCKLLFLAADQFKTYVESGDIEALKIIHNIALVLVEHIQKANELLSKIHEEAKVEGITKEIASYRQKLISEVLI